ncbi:MAG: hypothetical protein ACTFAK_11220 [Candidatus Electronema sp. VV]
MEKLFAVIPFFCFLCLTRPSFSATCSGLVDGLGYKNGSASCIYQMHVTYYDCQSLASDACNAAGGGCSTFSGAWFFSATGAGLPFGTLGYWRRGSGVGCDGTSDDIYLYVACAAGTCESIDLCADERAALEQQCGGTDKYFIDEETCNGRCNACIDEASQQCGGADKVEWNNDGDCSYECIGTCHEEREALEIQCGGPDRYAINEDTCVGYCKPLDCSGAKWALYQMCGGDNYFIDEKTCNGYCTGEGCQYQAENECGDLSQLEWIDIDKCDYHCIEPSDNCMSDAIKQCGEEDNIAWEDKSKCLYECIDKCTDKDKDGTMDACDYCPENPDIQNQVEITYRLNGNADICDKGYLTCDGRLVRISKPDVIYRDVDTICTPAESRVIPCSMNEDCEKDSDGDGTPDGADEDDDGDGIPDSEDSDRDGDGLPDSREDQDGDRIPDSIDPDDDNDDVPDRRDPDHDTDGDGKDNKNDPDDDGDGIPDEKDPDNTDCDKDGTVDSEDTDDDGDGTPDEYDLQKDCEEKDTDGDGVPDGNDSDTDGDGTPDVDDPDDDGDGIPDTEDPDDGDTDPSDDGGGDNGENIDIAGCEIDIKTLRSIISADNGKFPFNWLWAFANAFQPFVDIGGSEAPHIVYTFTFFGQQKTVDLHLERFQGVVGPVRFFFALFVTFYFMQFVVRLYNKIITGG